MSIPMNLSLGYCNVGGGGGLATMNALMGVDLGRGLIRNGGGCLNSQ